MKRTPAVAAAAAALGLLSGLGLEARASALTGEVAPHTVAVAWLTPGAPSPAGLEIDGPGAWAPHHDDRLTRLPPMRARVPEERVDQHRARRHLSHKLLATSSGCAREQAVPPALEVRRS